MRQYGIKPRRRLGQNFLVDSNLVEEILKVSDVSARENVLEIGAGLGTLTRFLTRLAAHVTAVEVDPILLNILRTELKDVKNLTIIDGDILVIPLPTVDTIVSNVPYSISSPLLLKTLESPTWWKAVLTFQKDFAARLVADVGSKEYGRLTIATTYYSEVTLHGSYSPKSFLPEPEVYSQIVRLERRVRPAVKIESPEIFWMLSRVLFTQRNRLLLKALKILAKGEELPKAWTHVLLEATPERFLTRRVRELGLEDLAALSDLLSSRAEIGLG